MSIIKSDVIREAAAATGIPSLREDVAASLAADAEYRLREIVQDALNFKRHSRRRKLTAADINNALRVRNVEPLYGFSFSEPAVYASKTGPDGTTVAVLEDKELEFDEILSAPLPKAPLEMTLRAHWLAIEGVQDVVSQELQLYYENVTSAVLLQGSPHMLGAALQSLRSDPGLQALLPYLTQFVTDEVARSLKDLDVLHALLAMTAALLQNPQLHVEPRLHQLMPAVMTCMVGKKLCKSALQAHWALRDRAAQLLTLIVTRYASSYATLQQRITNTLLHALLDAAKPLTTHYGAVVGLMALGPQTSNQLVVPNALAYLEALDTDPTSSKRRHEDAPLVIASAPPSKDGTQANLVMQKAAAAALSQRLTWPWRGLTLSSREPEAQKQAVGACLAKHRRGALPTLGSSGKPGAAGAGAGAGGESGGGVAGLVAASQRAMGDALLPYTFDPADPAHAHWI
ncbi:hypothetical protein T484DRAFT_1966945 [Baffinella frigidus]|nr:hypothetical protein T484DRAFT_1966945 [Cryptophyta sp. CCMP2293]